VNGESGQSEVLRLHPNVLHLVWARYWSALGSFVNGAILLELALRSHPERE